MHAESFDSFLYDSAYVSVLRSVQQEIAEDEIRDVHATLGKTVAVAFVDQKAFIGVALQLLAEDGMNIDLEAGLELDLGDTSGAAKPEKHKLLHLILHALCFMLRVQCRAALPKF